MPFTTEEIAERTIPHSRMIGRGHDSERLYTLEEQRNTAVEVCAKEWMKLCDVPKADYWRVAVPAALHDLLTNYESRCGMAAVLGYMRTEIPRHDYLRSAMIDRLRELVAWLEQMPAPEVE